MRRGFCSAPLTSCSPRCSRKVYSRDCSRRYAVTLRRCALMLALLISCQTISHSYGQGAAQAPVTAPGEHRKTSEPYTGDLSIFDSPGRDERLQMNRDMDILGITPGKTVADIGAGSGWFTVRAARRVGERGAVYAVDINPESIGYIDGRRTRAVAQHKDHPGESRRPAASRRCGGRCSALEDLSRSCRAGCAVTKTASGAASRRQGWNHRSKWKWRGPWGGPRRRPA